MNEKPTESTFTKKRRFLKQVAGLAGAGVGLALSPQTRRAADMLDSAARAAAAEGAKEVKSAFMEKWEGQSALSLTELDPETGGARWATTMANAPRIEKSLDSNFPPVGPEVFSLMPLINVGGSPLFLFESSNPKDPKIGIDANNRLLSIGTYTGKGNNFEQIIDINYTMLELDDRSLDSPETAAQIAAMGRLLFNTHTDILVGSDEAAAGVDVIVLVGRKLNGDFNGILSLIPTVAKTSDRYFAIEPTSTGLKDVKKNVGKPVEPIK